VRQKRFRDKQKQLVKVSVTDSNALRNTEEKRGEEIRVDKEKKGARVGLDDLAVYHIADWLAEKRKGGAYINHDPQMVLDGFRDYCQANGKKYVDYIAAYRNAFGWERFAPKQSQYSKSTENQKLANVRVIGGPNGQS
jgi:hypothetical protein